MFYRPEEPHGLRGDPLNAIVVPRPIGWVSTLDADGRANLACGAALPIAAPLPALRMDQDGDAGQLEQGAVVPAPVVLAPRHLVRVELEVSWTRSCWPTQPRSTRARARSTRRWRSRSRPSTSRCSSASWSTPA